MANLKLNCIEKYIALKNDVERKFQTRWQLYIDVEFVLIVN